jgi:hypothetical protein
MSRWWRDPETLTLLAREYGKFLLAETRGFLARAETADEGGAVPR